LFGAVERGIVHLDRFGEIVAEEWLLTGRLRPRVHMDAFVVMPNHLHGILVILGEGAGSRGTSQRAPAAERFGCPTSDSIPTIVRLFKSAVTKRINVARGTPGAPVWQRNYHDHVIRTDAQWLHYQDYIESNPARWETDQDSVIELPPPSG
jgi:REP element-mobilizing transposase RayT